MTSEFIAVGVFKNFVKDVLMKKITFALFSFIFDRLRVFCPQTLVFQPAGHGQIVRLHAVSSFSKTSTDKHGE